jgi:hypothetical protein
VRSCRGPPAQASEHQSVIQGLFAGNLAIHGEEETCCWSTYRLIVSGVAPAAFMPRTRGVVANFVTRYGPGHPIKATMPGDI